MRLAPSLRVLAIAAVLAVPALVRAACPNDGDPAVGITFDDSDHRQWYARFWTGKCDGLSFFQSFVCVSGKPFWFDSIATSLAKVDAARRLDLCTRLWDLGRLVGREWARANDVRKIDTETLEGWYRRLEEARDPAALAEELRREARRKLSQR